MHIIRTETTTEHVHVVEEEDDHDDHDDEEEKDPVTPPVTPPTPPVTPPEDPDTEVEPDPETDEEPDPPVTPPGPVDPIQTDSEVGDRLACHLIAKDFTVFDLHDLEKEDGSAYSTNTLNWKFCNYLPGKEYFAESTSGNGVQPLTNDEYLPSGTEVQYDQDDDTKITGIAVTRDSEEACGSSNYAFTTIILCDETITAKGEANIKAVNTDDACHPVVTVEHAAGCVQVTASPLFRWLADNPMVISIICLILGPLIMMFGNSHFPLIGATVGAVTLIDVILFFCAFMGWMGTTTYVWICLIVALICGVLLGVLFYKNIKVVLVLNAIVFGFVFGCFTYGLIAYFFEWYSFWGMIGIALGSSVLGGIISCRHAVGLVIWGTAFLGSWLFMSGLSSMVEENFMTESELAHKLYNGETIVFDGNMWFYLIFFVLCLVFSLAWQFKMHAMNEKAKWDGKHVWERDHTVVHDDF